MILFLLFVSFVFALPTIHPLALRNSEILWLYHLRYPVPSIANHFGFYPEETLDIIRHCTSKYGYSKCMQACHFYLRTHHSAYANDFIPWDPTERESKTSGTREDSNLEEDLDSMLSEMTDESPKYGKDEEVSKEEDALVDNPIWSENSQSLLLN